MKFAVIASAALVLCACSGGPNVRPEAPAAVNLSGSWLLNRQASEDPQAMLDAMRQKFLRSRREYIPPMTGEEMPEIDERGNPRQQRRPRGEMGSTDSGPQPDAKARERRERFIPGSSYARALGAVLTANSVKIEQSPTRFVITHGESRRSFTPGADSIISVADGVADQRSGWSGKQYVIEVRPQVGPRVIERYGLSADGRQLVESFTLTDEGVPKLEFTRVYEPGTPGQRALPTSN